VRVKLDVGAVEKKLVSVRVMIDAGAGKNVVGAGKR